LNGLNCGGLCGLCLLGHDHRRLNSRLRRLRRAGLGLLQSRLRLCGRGWLDRLRLDRRSGDCRRRLHRRGWLRRLSFNGRSRRGRRLVIRFCLRFGNRLVVIVVVLLHRGDRGRPGCRGQNKDKQGSDSCRPFQPGEYLFFSVNACHMVKCLLFHYKLPVSLSQHLSGKKAKG
jgi:hypothetical protein